MSKPLSDLTNEEIFAQINELRARRAARHEEQQKARLEALVKKSEPKGKKVEEASGMVKDLLKSILGV
jgi:hypothetical protein